MEPNRKRNTYFRLAIALFLLAMILSISCRGRPSSSLVLRHFDTVRWQEELEDYGPLGKVNQLHWYKDRLFISSFDNNQVVEVAETFQVVNTIGSSGQGPGELGVAGKFLVNDEYLFIHDQTDSHLNLFGRDGAFERRIETVPTYTSFAFYQGRFFYPTPGKKQPISVYDLDGSISYSFGVPYASEEFRVRRAQSHWHLDVIQLEDQAYILATAWTLPMIELYDLEGQLVFRKDLSDFALFQDRLELQKASWQKNPKKRESSFTIITATDVFENRIYLLPVVSGDYGYLAVFEVSTKGLEHLENITFPFIIRHFAVQTPDIFYGYDERHQILHRFEPKEWDKQ